MSDKDELLMSAARFAKTKHDGQFRKYSGRHYIEHPMRVAGYAMLLPVVNPEMVAAAWLHDVIEDCGVAPDEIRHLFGSMVESIVVELTNPSKQHPELRRHERKAMDRRHIGSASYAAKVLKLIDRADNLGEIDRESSFAALYARESLLLVNVLCGVDAYWEHRVRQLAEGLIGTEN